MLAQVFIMLLVVLALIAALKDVLGYTIPNWVVLALMALYPIAGLVLALPWSFMASGLLASVLILCIGIALFAPGWIGAGDAKLFAVIALWVGWSDLLTLSLYTVLWGGALAFVLLISRRYAPTIPIFAVYGPKSLTQSDAPAPYGVAIAAGLLTLLPNSQLLSVILS